MYNWNDLVDEFEAMSRFSCVPEDIRKVPADYVFDENKSVKWNREAVAANNAEYLVEVARLNTIKNKRRDAIVESAIGMIQSGANHDLSYKKARVLWNFAYEHGHANGFYDVVAKVQELICLADELLD